jgi:hypothetical protein
MQNLGATFKEVREKVCKELEIDQELMEVLVAG